VPSAAPDDAVSKLEGKVALVTGAGQGVGRGIAIELAAQGAAVMICGRTMDKLSAVVAEIEATGGSAAAVPCDVKDASQIEACVAAVIERFGRLDVLVNNAQEAPMGPMLEVTDEAVMAGWESGAMAVLRFMRASHPHLVGHGVIVNLSSSASVNPYPVGRGAYAGVKAAINAMTRAAGVEWGVDGIRVVCIMPRAMTPAAEAFAARHPDDYRRGLETIPLRREGDAQSDIGRAVAFLCSDDAAYITATSIAVDGGQAYLR